MNENRHSTQPDSARLAKRTKLVDSFQRQKSATGGVTKKRKGTLAEQSPYIRNQATTVQAPGARKDPKKMSKVEIPVSLDIDPFSTTESITSPLSRMDEMLLAKEGQIGDVTLPESRKSAATPSPQLSEAEIAALRARANKVELENDTLKRALSEAKADLTATEERLRKKEVIVKNLVDTHVHPDVMNKVVAEKRLLQDKLEGVEERLREKDNIIRDRDERIEDLINDRVPRDDLNDVIVENQVLQGRVEELQEELEDKDTLLAECKKLLEEYAATDEA
ncbi:hypothetical protein GGI17_002895 [Coemansia sp. S146]|nr:hypothetical protein GGI17_002895 [Coemansia sp. S146]